jgi:hypothetical protein
LSVKLMYTIIRIFFYIGTREGESFSPFKVCMLHNIIHNQAAYIKWFSKLIPRCYLWGLECAFRSIPHPPPPPPPPPQIWKNSRKNPESWSLL